MALTDFLFNGSPPASTTTYGTTSASMPAWYSDYTQGLISKANAIASTPYSAYTGARLAAPTGAQTNAWGMTQQNADAYKQPFQQAQNTAQSLQGTGQNALYNQNLPAGTPQAGNLFQGAAESAGNIASSAAGNLANAQTATQAGQGPASGVTQPYLDQQQQFLNPVYSNIDRLGAERLGAQQQGIRDQFIRGGSFGGSRMGGAYGAAQRASTADIAGQKAGLAQQGYNQAVGAGQQDLQRQLQAAGQFGQLGASQAGLQAQQAQAQSGLGSQLGQFNQADLARRLQAAQTGAQIGQTQATTGTQQAGALEAAGQAQQQVAQRGLDLAYGDYQKQLNYPTEQLSTLNSAIRGLQIPTQSQTSQTGPASVYQASPLSQLASAGAGAAGLGKLFS